MSGRRPDLDSLLAAIADGRAIDWEAAAPEEPLVAKLKLIAAVAEVHRTPDPARGGEANAERTGVLERIAGAAEAPGSDAVSPPPPATSRWGALELREPIGGGAFGEVFRARDPQLERDVALKLLHPRWSGGRQVARLLREARMLARLRHPNVVAVYGADVREGRAGLWMELVAGRSLEALLQAHGTFGAREAAGFGLEVCRALAAVHGAGLVHGDVKAGNVVREEGGRIVLMDFGASRLGDRRGGAARVETTPLYAAPELLEGAEPAVASDVYSVGVLLYHLVTGTYPVTGASVQDLRDAHAGVGRVPLRDARADLAEAFVQVVERALAPAPADRFATAGALASALSRAVGLDVAGPPPARARRLSRSGWWGLATAAALGAGLWGVPGPWRQRPAAPAATPAASVAILPFENLTGDAGWGALARGLADDLGRELQSFGVVVKGRDARPPAGDVEEALRKLHVDRVVAGSLGRTDGDVVLSLTLQGEPGGDAWQRRYQASLEAVSGVHRQVASDIASALGAGPGTPRRAGPAHVAAFKAYEAYHRGRVYWELRSREGLQTSIAYFREAARLDPGYPQPWAGLADAYIALGVPAFGALRPQAARSEATAAALRALELNPGLAEAHTSLAFVAFFYDWNWSAAEARFRKALEASPNYALAHHWYADFLNAVGRPQEASAEILKAAELEPLSVLIHRDVAWHHFFQRRYAEAAAQLRRTLALDPRYAPARSLLGRVLIEDGKAEEGLRELHGVAPDLPRSTAAALLAYGEAAAGRRARAAGLLGELAAIATREYVSPYSVALVHARLGRSSDALGWLEKAFAEQDTTMVNLRADPRWDPLRDHPRFKALVARMGFPPSRGGERALTSLHHEDKRKGEPPWQRSS